MIIFMIMSSFIVALLVRYTHFTESLYSYITVAIGLLALFFGGFIAGIKRKANGLFVGICTGVLFTIIVFLIQFLGYDTSFTIKQSLYHLLYMIAAIVGSVIGVNSVRLAD